MFALLLTAVLASTDAHAADGARGETVLLDASLQAMQVTHDGSLGDLAGETSTDPALALGVRVDLGRAYGTLEGRGLGGGLWTGRVAGGLHVLKRVDAVDIDLGLFGGAGGVVGGDSAVLELTPLMGVELGLGLHLGRFGGRFRHSEGLTSMWREEEVRIGVDVLDNAEVFGRYTRLSPGDNALHQGVGVGVGMRF